MAKGQTNVEYLLILAAGTVMILFAVLGMLHMMGIITDEIEYLKKFQESIIEVLTA